MKAQTNNDSIRKQVSSKTACSLPVSIIRGLPFRKTLVSVKVCQRCSNLQRGFDFRKNCGQSIDVTTAELRKHQAVNGITSAGQLLPQLLEFPGRANQETLESSAEGLRFNK